jgi:hypothetical protein
MDWSCYYSVSNLVKCLGNQSDHWLNVDNAILTALGIIVVVVIALWRPIFSKLLAGTEWLRSKIVPLFTRRPSGVPAQTIVVVPLPDSRWQLGTSGGSPCLFLFAHFKVTNIHGHGLELAKTYVRKPHVYGGLVVRPERIEPQNPAEVMASYVLVPPPRVTRGKPFDAVIVIVDSIGVERRQRVTFRSI